MQFGESNPLRLRIRCVARGGFSIIHFEQPVSFTSCSTQLHQISENNYDADSMKFVELLKAFKIQRFDPPVKNGVGLEASLHNHSGFAPGVL